MKCVSKVIRAIFTVLWPPAALGWSGGAAGTEAGVEAGTEAATGPVSV